jgi:hypothetical protein
MTPQTDPRLQKFADYFGLQIEYSTELPDKVPGLLKLDSDCAYIVLNANKPPCDHALTIGHEMGHYVMHQHRVRRFDLPWFVNRPWKWKLAREIAQGAKTHLLQKFDGEWEADFWAFIFLWHIGDVGYLMGIVELYPEKRALFWLSWLAVVFGGIRRRGKNLFSGLFPATLA